MGGGEGELLFDGFYKSVCGVQHELRVAPGDFSVVERGESLKEVEYVVLGAVEGAVQIRSGVGFPGGDTVEEIKVVLMDGLCGLDQLLIRRQCGSHVYNPRMHCLGMPPFDD